MPEPYAHNSLSSKAIQAETTWPLDPKYSHFHLLADRSKFGIDMMMRSRSRLICFSLAENRAVPRNQAQYKYKPNLMLPRMPSYIPVALARSTFALIAIQTHNTPFTSPCCLQPMLRLLGCYSLGCGLQSMLADVSRTNCWQRATQEY